MYDGVEWLNDEKERWKMRGWKMKEKEVRFERVGVILVSREKFTTM